MECNKDNLDLIDFNKFNDSINKYNEETKGELKEFFSTCDTKNNDITDGPIKGGASRNAKLNKYFFIILCCLIFSVFTKEIFRELIFIILPSNIVYQLSISFISLLKYIVINRCASQIPILNDMCPLYKDLFIEFLNNLEIILIKLSPILKYGLGLIINGLAIRDIYNDSKIYYFLLNNPEFIEDIEYPENTEFIVNKNNYPRDFVEIINSSINGPTQTTIDGIETNFSTQKFIPKHIKKLKYQERTVIQNQDNIVEVDKFITNNDETVYLNPIYTRFYINIGYLSVSYISDEQAKIEINSLLKDRAELKKILQLLELKYNIPEQFMRKLSLNLGYGYKSSIVKSQLGITNESETKSSLGGKLTKTIKYMKIKKSNKLKKRKSRKSKRKSRRKSKRKSKRFVKYRFVS